MKNIMPKDNDSTKKIEFRSKGLTSYLNKIFTTPKYDNYSCKEFLKLVQSNPKLAADNILQNGFMGHCFEDMRVYNRKLYLKILELQYKNIIHQKSLI
jgi:hypothetical protein